MIKYISFLRGINVGGHKIIKMENLKRLFELMGFKDVTTFIQSGNVSFKASLNNREIINRQIEDYLQKSLGYKVESFTRTIPEIESIVKNNPYKSEVLDKSIKMYLSFLRSEPSTKDKITLEQMSYDAEKFCIIGSELYTLLIKHKIKDKSVFSNNMIEKKLRISSTTRDWNTVNKVLLI
jgi:uncharacterized protein (DUF1697 family)